MQKYTRQAKPADLSRIMSIIQDAKSQLKAAGSSQWQGTYPAEDDIATDIKEEHGFVFINGQEIAGYAAVIVGAEPTYQKIDGAWQNDQAPYATIHRICFSSAYQGEGLAKIFMADLLSLQVAQGIINFRIDTSKYNQPMQAVAKRSGFVYRGIIQVTEDKENPDRLAYELNLK